jgi:hypothetical protein
VDPDPDADPALDADPVLDADSALFISELQDTNKKIFFFSLKFFLFEGTFTSSFKDYKS